MLKRTPLTLSHQRPANRPRFKTRAGEVGFTLVELVVCIAILGVVIIPLSATMVVGFRSTEDSESGLTASVNRDQIAEQFTKDVAQVDAAGVSTDTGRTCGAPTDATLFVNLNRTRLVSGVPQVDRISYYSTGSGKNIGIARYACTNVSPTTSGTGTMTMVAHRLGNTGQVRTDVVGMTYSTDKLANGSDVGFVPCTEFMCGFAIHGRYEMQITAQRRIFGAGVPLENGVYSSSITREQLLRDGTANGQQYDLYGTTDATNGVDATNTGLNANEKLGTEKVFSNQITLAAGLDGPSNMGVRIAVESKTAGPGEYDQSRFLNSSGTAFDQVPASGTSRVPASAWITLTAADYNGTTTGGSAGFWRLPLKVSPSYAAKYGGEYRVYTELTPKDQPTKQYGGANGFPFYIDWRPTNSIFVDPSATVDGDGLTPQSPTNKLSTGLVQASVSQYNRPNIVITNGTVKEQLDLSGNSLAANDTSGNISNNRTITGGHSRKTWLRGGWMQGDLFSGAATTTQLKTPDNYVDPITKAAFVVKINKRTGLRFRQVGISNGTTTGLPAGTSTYGVVAEGGSFAIFENSTIRSGKAADGAAGTAGTAGNDGCYGNDGKSGTNSRTTGAKTSATLKSGSTVVTYNVANPPANCTVSGDRVAGYGGAGGKGGYSFLGCSSACNGETGGNGAGTPAAAGGAGGDGGTFPVICLGGDAKPGKPGWSVTSVGGGSGGTTNAPATPQRPNGLWNAAAAASPTAGAAAPAGRGGSGGGGGGGNCLGNGASGGTGGQGAGGGGGGGAGGNGGGSFGVYVYGNSTLFLHNMKLQAGKGGNGGAGGKGGAGGTGGIGGAGSPNNGFANGDSSGAGGGGDGGGGGGGGAPGIGGPSVTAFMREDSRLPRTGTSLGTDLLLGEGAGAPGAVGDPGAGGAGGLGGAGSNGTVYTTIPLINIIINVTFFAGSSDTPQGPDGGKGNDGLKATAPDANFKPANCMIWLMGNYSGWLGDSGNPAAGQTGDSRGAYCGSAG